LLPIDSKLPLEDYQKMLEAPNNNIVKEYQKKIFQSVKNNAKDIYDKYIDLPHTTDFAIMFIPLESLYLQIISLDIQQEIYQKYHVIINGPSTLAALLNSLQLGFKTIVIQEKTTQIYELLNNIKKEFITYESILSSSQKKLQSANEDIEKLVTTRTRKIIQQLNKIEETK
ncbi:MAG: DNA recombination protein RmuC, partial [Erysipelotrichaceae bacterium]